MDDKTPNVDSHLWVAGIQRHVSRAGQQHSKHGGHRARSRPRRAHANDDIGSGAKLEESTRKDEGEDLRGVKEMVYRPGGCRSCKGEARSDSRALHLAA